MVMISQWNSSLSVLPVARVMISQWGSSLSVLPVARVQFPTMVEYLKRFFPWLITCAPYTQFWEYPRAEWPLLNKSLQSHEDHERPTDHPGLRQKNPMEVEHEVISGLGIKPGTRVLLRAPSHCFTSKSCYLHDRFESTVKVYSGTPGSQETNLFVWCVVIKASPMLQV